MYFQHFQMWIFSLGRTLLQTILLKHDENASSFYQTQHQFKFSMDLQTTIFKMCNRELGERASLMYLLNVSTLDLLSLQSKKSKTLSILQTIRNCVTIYMIST